MFFEHLSRLKKTVNTFIVPIFYYYIKDNYIIYEANNLEKRNILFPNQSV